MRRQLQSARDWVILFLMLLSTISFGALISIRWGLIVFIVFVTSWRIMYGRTSAFQADSCRRFILRLLGYLMALISLYLVCVGIFNIAFTWLGWTGDAADIYFLITWLLLVVFSGISWAHFRAWPRRDADFDSSSD